MTKIAFIHQGEMSFVSKDSDILRSRYQVRDIKFVQLKNITDVWKGIVQCDLAFCWFGKLHAFFAVLFSKMLRKKLVVVAGGEDVVNEPEIRYGMFAFWWKKWCPLFVFRYADLILSVSAFNLSETVQNARASNTETKLLYHGFDSNKFKMMDVTEKEQLVITVGGVDWERLERKGYKRFVRSAAYLPEAQFALIGQWHDDAIDHLREVASNNVTFTGRVTDEELLKWFSRAKVYVQASVHEAFGCSLAEAMLCECVPVVSQRAALPEVVGDCGFYVDDLSPESVAEKVKEALSVSEDLGKKARQRIKTVFPLEKRKMELLRAIEGLRD